MIFDDSDYPLDEKTDMAVMEMVSAIVRKVNSLNPSIEVDVDHGTCLNSTEEYSSSQASISSKFGIIVILPNFRNKTAYGCVLNKGIIHNMQSEGFDDEFIQSEGKIYSDPIVFNDSNVHLLGYYLTHKI